MPNVYDLIAPSSAATNPDEGVDLTQHEALLAPFIDELKKHADDGELFGLVEKFESHQLTDKLQSWIGRGEDQPLSADEVKVVLGDQFLQSLVENMPAGPAKAVDAKLLDGISTMLPVVVRLFTRSGQIPPKRVLVRKAEDVKSSLVELVKK